jgi:hypothetical protein
MRLTLKDFEHEFDDTTGALVRSTDHSSLATYPDAGVPTPKHHTPLHLSRPSWEHAYHAINEKTRFEKMRTLLCRLYGEAIRRDLPITAEQLAQEAQAIDEHYPHGTPKSFEWILGIAKSAMHWIDEQNR